ncbi:MAG: RNA polymerase sigma factor [Muribaculaceae bacterium]|nr:RNA polymerase sigma factor [Muribaculaceae bacterium]
MNPKVFTEKLLRLQSNMLSFATMLTSNRDDAYDLLQDTTLKALDNRDKYSENTNFKGWVFTIMRNIFINGYRRTTKFCGRLSATDDIYNMELSVGGDAVVPSPEGSYSWQEVQGAINELLPQYGKPFSMLLAGYRYAEIARAMHLPVGTIKSRIYYARQKLRSRLRDYSID